MKTRIVKGGGLRIWQIITKYLVFSLCNNRCWSNGDKGWSVDVKLRKNTAL